MKRTTPLPLLVSLQMSMLLRNVHEVITKDYEMPYYVSYILFAVLTVLLGGFLGLVLVCCVDCIYPFLGGGEYVHRPRQPPPPPRAQEREVRQRLLFAFFLCLFVDRPV